MKDTWPHPDRLLGIDAEVRLLAREFYEPIAQAPIISPHGHVSAQMLARNEAFSDPAQLLVTHDHYVTRLLHAHGVSLDRLGLGAPQTAPREVWRTLCSHWSLFAGTPVAYWLEDSLSRVFSISERPSAEAADRLYDAIAERLTDREFRPRELLTSFGVEVLATTDDPADTLEHHLALRSDPGFPVRVLPTLRADAYMNPASGGWRACLARLSEASGSDCDTYAGLLEAIRRRRIYFKDHGATATDCGVPDAWAAPLNDTDAQALHDRAMTGLMNSREAVAYARNMLFQFGLMAAEDRLVMQLHAGVVRNHHLPTLQRFGPDTGHDLPGVGAFTEPLRALLNQVGTEPNFRIVLFTVDEATFSREIAPLAGFYPSVYAGAPWWFLDAPAAIGRYRAAVTAGAGFYKTSGFIDDTRALCSIPSRHDMSRRLDSRALAELVLNGELSKSDAHRVAAALVDAIPRSTFRLDEQPA